MRFLLLLTELFVLVCMTNGEIRDFRVVLEPDPTVVHYSEGYLQAPGSIDLSDLHFAKFDMGMDFYMPNENDEAFDAAIEGEMEDEDDDEELVGPVDDDGGGLGDDDQVEEILEEMEEEEAEEAAEEAEAVEEAAEHPPGEPGNGGGGEGGGGDGGGRRHLKTKISRRQNSKSNNKVARSAPRKKRSHSKQSSRHRLLADEEQKIEEEEKYSGGMTQVDVAVVHLPRSCANTRSGCDWIDLGIGAEAPDGDVRWCCSGDAPSLGLCKEGPQYYGQLILNNNFNGTHRYVTMPADGGEDADDEQQIKWGEIEELQSGQYIVILANCNNNYGRYVKVTGETVWKSKHGYLPGELFGFMYFYRFIVAVYIGAFFAYMCAMRRNVESRIDIEKWIFGTIIMGLSEMVVRTVDYAYWNWFGNRLVAAVYAWVLIGVMKRAISRCLIVMVSMGWGVVKDSLGPTLQKIIFIGIFYVGVSAVRDFMIEVAVEDVQTLTTRQEDEIFSFVQVLTFLVAAVDVIFILWSLDGLNGTMEDLESFNQTRKLMRFLRLRCIFLFSVLFAVVWAVFSLVDTYDENGILEEQHEWIVDAATQLNYLFLLMGVAFLWWPNPAAKEYAYQMELPSSNTDEDGVTELELTGVVPSAADDDDDDVDKENGDSFDDNFDDEFEK